MRLVQGGPANCALEACIFKHTEYFRFIRTRPDRAQIQEAWIFAALESPDAEETQSDGRIRRWRYIPEAARFLRVVLLADGETVHNAFFDRRFRP